MLKYFFPLILGINISLGGTSSPQESNPAIVVSRQDNFRYVGATTCQSSMCHGGASPSRCQFTTWSRDDFHSRAYATLVTPRSARMAESLGLTSATESVRCTICHAPDEAIPATGRASTVDATEGVSCEQCHAAAGFWLRGHTRPDWTYADRIHAGLRDLRDAYVRAETCVACHQVIDTDLVKAGHPELIFELDGQTASEPRHWQEKETWFGPKAWLVGQAAALREISLRLAGEAGHDSGLAAEQQALVWLLTEVNPVPMGRPSSSTASSIAAWSDQMAQLVSGLDWKRQMSLEALASLAATSPTFLDDQVPVAEQALRAERLVMGMDRLFKSLHLQSPAPGEKELLELFAAVQNRDQFDPKAFSRQLHQFAGAMEVKK